MPTKRQVKKTSGTQASVTPKEGMSGAISRVAESKVSRRTLLKGTGTAAAAVGVAAVLLETVQVQGLREQLSYPGIQTASTVSIPPTPTTFDPFASQPVTFTVNGASQTVFVEPRDTLALVLREDLGLIGTKLACNRMMCGACTVLVNGVPTDSCQYLALWADGKTILTTEAGVAPTPSPGSSSAPTAPADRVVAALQSAWVQEDGGQCGFCSPGQIMMAAALLKSYPNPSVDDIKNNQLGNLCRCGNYPNIIASIQTAAKSLGSG
jgi:aerobic-type carbon monoxide dehydrogenase small subunit (CoxS/CutS family)